MLSFSLLWHYVVTMKTDLEGLLQSDPRVERLLKNPNWKPAADAAMKFFLTGEDCPITSWKKSSTWAQVKMVWEELKKSS